MFVVTALFDLWSWPPPRSACKWVPRRSRLNKEIAWLSGITNLRDLWPFWNRKKVSEGFQILSRLLFQREVGRGVNLEQVTMLHGDMVKHISCNPLGANGAGLRERKIKMKTDQPLLAVLTIQHKTKSVWGAHFSNITCPRGGLIKKALLWTT